MLDLLEIVSSPNFTTIFTVKVAGLRETQNVTQASQLNS